ncbi:hypothetical protein KY289_018982 [Solanum tuberosum]|nr:hypothetical protein KY289_018982 [Solanum tuberosum]
MPAPFLIGTFLLVVGMDLISSINCAPNKLVLLTGNTKRLISFGTLRYPGC